MDRIILLAVFFLFISYVVVCQNKSAVIAGVVRDETGSPLAMVNVQLVGTHDGDATDSRGRFLVKTEKRGAVVVRASLIGYEPVNRNLTLSGNDSVVFNITFYESSVRLQEVVVAGNAITTGSDIKGLTLHSLDVMTTPGASGDIFRVIQTFPGVATLDEGSGLFVRGGDVSETAILLDQATVVHPYKFESPTGGFFGTIPPFLVGGTFFSSGGFSARYGNALSGVLAMESMNMPSQLTASLGIGLAAGSLAVGIPIVPNTLGIRISGNKSFMDAMLRLNGMRNRFTIPPDGFDGNVSVIWKYSPTAQIKFFTFINTDKIGVQMNEPSFIDAYVSSETNWLQNLQWTGISNQWVLKGSLSLNRFTTEQNLGNLHLRPSDFTYKARFDAEENSDDDHRLLLGAESEKMTNRYEGTVPQNPYVLDPQGSIYTLHEDYSAMRIGVYTEYALKLSRGILTSIGVRSDYYNLSKQAVVDPRLSIRYDLSNEMHVQASWGIYHQFAQPYLYNRGNGNPLLSAQSARHLTAGIEYAGELLMCRIETYRKTYSDLVLRCKSTQYANMGDGSAVGVDLFVKYGAFLQTPVNGWVSYSYLHSKRLQARDLIDRYLYEESPSSFDITHNLTVVAKAQLAGFVSAGLTFRCATGKPHTPIGGAVSRAGGAYYEPIQGEVNSERYPHFVRLDGSLSYFCPFGERNSAVFYLGITNILNRANPILYEYSFDYSQRTLRTTDYRQSIYFGMSVSFGSYGIEN